jgi:predicted signal transduction protein with EAL and GGDEF domain
MRAVVIGEFVSFFAASSEPDLESLVVAVLELAVSSVSLFVMV